METKRIKISDTKNINDEELKEAARSYVTEVLLHFQQKLYMV